MKSRVDFFRTLFLAFFIFASLVVFWSDISSVIKIYTQVGGYVDVGSIVPILTSLIALAGFLVTTYFTSRKDKRESKEFELSLKQKEIELERMRLELEQMRKSMSAKTKHKTNKVKSK